MDARRSHELPRLQIGWIDNVCLPLYKVRKLLIKCIFQIDNYNEYSFFFSYKEYVYVM